MELFDLESLLFWGQERQVPPKSLLTPSEITRWHNPADHNGPIYVRWRENISSRKLTLQQYA
jgi:hypothetical protein